jgi:uncharacterized iron-regulated membrane protein
MSFRKTIFWLHLIAGVVAGAIILVMCVTGAAIAFEKEAIAAAEKSVAKVTPPADATRLPLEELLAKVAEAKPGAPSGVTVFADPAAAVLVAFGRTNTVYVNPYSGEAKEAAATTTRGLMRTLTDWHRWLGREGDGRAVGKAITGACNVAFLFLAVSGLILWAPRVWSWTSVRAVMVLRWNARGKARDWNWHNVIGFWSAPVLIVLTLSGMIISYRWASDLVYKIAGSPVPGAATPAPAVPKPEAGAKPLTRAAQLLAAQKEFPNWEQITFRISGGGAGPQAVALAIRERKGWPLFAPAQVWLDPFTGAVLRKETFADYNTGRKARMWLRYLHTGEAFGFVGKALAAAASAGGAVLVWTGFALAIRRFLNRKQSGGATTVDASTPEAATLSN